MKTMTALIISSVVLFLSVVANADEMSWEVKNRSKMECKLADGMTLRTANDVVYTKRLVCRSHGDYTIIATVACGPEGSTTTFDGRKIKVTCSQSTYAIK